MKNFERQYFYYEAFDENQNFTSYIVAKDEYEAYEILTSTGLNIIDLRKQTYVENLVKPFYHRLPIEGLIFFFRQLSFALGSGLSLQRAISLGSSDYKNKKMRDFISHIQLMLSRGFSFSESLALAPYELPLIVLEWVKVGEAKGKLDVVLEEIAVYLEKEHNLKRELKNQMSYPIIILIMLIGFLILLSTYFIPMLEDAYLDFGIPLPNSLEIFILVSSVFRKMKYFLLALILLFLYLILIDYRSIQEKFYRICEKTLLKISGISMLIKLHYFISFIRMIGLLLKENIPMISILTILADERKNGLYKDAVMAIRESILSGQGLSKSLSSCYFIPPTALQMLKLSDESGSLPDVCLFLADYYERLQKERIKKIIKLLEPMMIILFGFIVLFLALAFYVPIISSYEQFFNV